MSRLDQLHPDLRPKAEKILKTLEEMGKHHGFTVYIASAYRSPAKQWKLFKHGRAFIGGKWVVKERRKILTWAKPSQSPHCFKLRNEPASLAVDMALRS